MKYRLTDIKIEVFGRTLFRIEALESFGNVKKGELGGYVENQDNLSQDGNAWVCGDAEVCGNAKVYGNAEVYGNARVCGDAEVCGDARVYGNAEVYGNAWVYGNADYLLIGPIGSRKGFTTFFKTKDNEIYVKCGCFRGNIKEFTNEVERTHKDNYFAKEYKQAIRLAELHILGEKNGRKNCNIAEAEGFERFINETK